MTALAKPRVLLVDDEEPVLRSLTLHLRREFEVAHATRGEDALKILGGADDYAVVVSDMRMPGMNGATLLAKARAVRPDTTRVLLTGQTDLASAIAAVNDGQIYRFLTKPTEADRLRATLGDAVRQHELLTAERDLLERTLRSSVKVLTDVLGLVNPEAFSRASRVHEITAKVASTLGIAEAWQVELAALLSQLGCVTLPPDLVARAYRGEALGEAEQKAFAGHVEVARRLVAAIPRLEPTAAMIAYRPTAQSGSTFARGRDAVACGGEIVAAALEFDRLAQQLGPRAAVPKLQGRVPPDVLAVLESARFSWQGEESATILLRQLQVGMVLKGEVRSENGVLLAASGTHVSETLLNRLLNFAMALGIKEPLEVLKPQSGT